ncbi:MAG: putative glycolipid-binding domain-containing protein [Thermoanaerobaculia bacterium]
MVERTVLWRRLDRAGHEACRLLRMGDGWLLEGGAVLVHEGAPCSLAYHVACDAAWRTRTCRVTGWLGERTVDVEIEVGGDRSWRLNGEVCPEVADCVDVDLNFSPSTNLLPIRRLGLAVGSAAPVKAAWLRFPSFHLEPLEQVYRRIGETAYRYESAGGRFTADLEVDQAGFVTRYPGLAELVG